MKKLSFLVLALCLVLTDVAAQKFWQRLGSSTYAVNYYPAPAFIIDKKDNTPYVIYRTGSDVRVKKFDGRFWVNVGFNPQITGNGGYYPSIAVDNNSTLYIAYRDDAKNDKATVMRHNGSLWVPVGVEGFSAGKANYTTVAVDNNNVPYLAFQDETNNGKATVMKFNGTSWVIVGVAGFSTANAYELNLKFDSNNVPYLAFINAGKVTVMKYSNNNWAAVGNAGSASGYVSSIAFDIDSKDTPYVAYRDYNDSLKVTVLKYDNSQWQTVGKRGFSNFSTTTNSYFDIDMVLDGNNTPYVSYNDKGSVSDAVVKMYNGNSWVSLDDTYFYYSTPFATEIELATDSNDVLYAQYVHNSGFQTPLAVEVRKYDCPAQPHVEICAITTDTTTGKNTIVWDDDVPYVDSYKIYKEDKSSYKLLVSLPGTANMFVDTSAIVGVQCTYKLVLLDSCGRQTNIDSAKQRNSINLAYNYFTGDTVSITWNSYKGSINPLYRITRSNNGGAFSVIDSFNIAGSDTTYLDVAPPSGNCRYRIEIAVQNPCTLNGLLYDKVLSNIVSSWQICAVTTDSVNDDNVIIWDNPNLPSVDSFRVYRKDDSVYKLVSSVDGSSNSYKDTSANTSLQSYGYKVTVLYKNGKEIELDAVENHKTAKLTFNSLIGNNAVISWNVYEGLLNPTYIVKRSNNGSAFLSLASSTVSGADTSYTDFNVPSGVNRYRVDILLSNLCGNIYDRITSNIVTSWTTGVNKMQERLITVMPNPTNKELYISANEIIKRIDVYSITGKLLLTSDEHGEKETIINVQDLPPGIYILKVNGVMTTKFIKQ